MNREIRKKNEELKLVDQADIPAIDMLEDFEEEFGVDVEEMIDKAFLDPGYQPEEQDLPFIQTYKEWLYEEAPEGEYEDIAIKNDAFNNLVDDYSDNLVSPVASRREKTLGFAI